MIRLLQQWVCEQAQYRPEAVAVVMCGQNMTYGQLEAQSNQLARLLQAIGCRTGDRVAFAIPKSAGALVAILGILKADCIHVPIDIASPSSRVARILQSSMPRYVMGVSASGKLFEQLFAHGPDLKIAGIGWLEPRRTVCPSLTPAFTHDDLVTFSADTVVCQNRSQDPAHILYTSGSTGDPKGVVITHSNVIHFVEWATKYFGMDSSDRVSCHSPLHFDLSTFDIFGAFRVGAEIHLVPPELNVLPNKLADFIRASKLTQWFSVPSVLNYLAKFDVVKQNDFPALKRLLWCGEVFPTPALVYWMKRLPGVQFTNLYGPTEATIASSFFTVPECPTNENAKIPIGTACDGEELLVLDANLEPVSPGSVGELYIRGVGLSPCYWQDRQKSISAFLPYGPGGCDRIYRTGDLAHVGTDGMIYFMGRIDSQIKSRGYRIELGEIEAALNALPEVRECAVVAISGQGFDNNVICCAYALARGAQATGMLLRRKLQQFVPDYMLPARWLCLEQLPTNSNGKIDRRKLRECFSNPKKPTSGTGQVTLAATSRQAASGRPRSLIDAGSPTNVAANSNSAQK